MKKILPLLFIPLVCIFVWEMFRESALDSLRIYPKAGIYSVDQATADRQILRVDLIRLDPQNPEGPVLGMKQYHAIRQSFGNYVVVGNWGQMVWTGSLSQARDYYGMIDSGREGW